MARRACAFLTALCTLMPLAAAQAQTASGDLTSTAKTIAATAAGTIRVGAGAMKVQVGQMLTPAEAMALSQVLSAGRQSLILGTLGNAVAGRLNVTSSLGTSVTNLTVPRGVTVFGDLSSSNLNFTGNLVNSGRMYLYSTTPGSTAGINAYDILNQRGALLSTWMPASLMGANYVRGLSLDLTALNNLVNMGIIRSAGSLSLTAGNAITNTGLLQAANNVNLISNQITNHNLVQATTGNINISALNTGNIYVDNRSGVLQAMLGNINVRDALFSAKSNFDLIGGNALSKQLNIFSGNGIANVDLKNLTGMVNINAGEAHVLAATRNLQLGIMNLTGDPTFFNTAGDVTIGSDLNFSGQALAVVASGNILSSGSHSINTSSPLVGGGGAITLVAGAKFTTFPVVANSLPPSGDNTTTLTITGGSATGGKIDLVTGGAINAFDSSSTSGSGGDIRLIAYKGTGSGSGTISLPGPLTINASGVGHAGNVTAIAGATSGTGISLGNIVTTNGGSGTGGDVSLYTATPKIVSGTSVQILDGAITAGDFAPGTGTASSVSFGSSTAAPFGITNDGNLNITTNGQIVAGNIDTGKNVSLTANGADTSNANSITINGTIKSRTGNITATSGGGSINFGGNIVATNGDVSLTAKGSIIGLNHNAQTVTATGSGFAAQTWQFLLGAVLNKAGTFVYVPDWRNNSVSIIDVSQNNKVVAVVTAGFNAPQGMVLSPDGGTLYVANWGDNTISKMDAGTHAVTTLTSGISGRPENVTLSPDGSVLYVLSDAASSGFTGAATFTAIRTSDGAILKSIPVQLGSGSGAVIGTAIQQTGGIVVNPQNTTVYISCSGSKNVFTVDVSALDPTGLGPHNASVTGVINMAIPALLKEAPFNLALDPNGTRLYVAESFLQRGTTTTAPIVQGGIAVIDITPHSTTFNSVIATNQLPTSSTPGAGSFPQGLSVNATGTELLSQATYLPYSFSNYTGVNQTIEYIPVGAGPDGYGSTQFTGIVTTNGVPVQTTYTSNTLNLTPLTPNIPWPVQDNTVSVVTKPTIQANNITLHTTSGNILVDYDTKGGVITANAGGGGAVMMNNLGTVASFVGNSSASTNLFEIGSIAPLNIAGTITGARLILQTTGTAGINFESTAKVGTSTNIVAINTGSGNITQQAGAKITGSQIDFTSTFGSIGSNSSPISTSTGKLTALVGGTGNVYLSNNKAVSLNAASAGGTFSLTNAGTITIPTTSGVYAPNVNLMTTAGNIAINNQIGLANTPGNVINLEAFGALTMGLGGYQIYGDTVNLQTDSTNASMGSASIPIRTTAANVSATNSAISGSGSAYINNSGNLNILSSIVNANFVVTSTGNITINGLVQGATKTASVTTKGGTFDINMNGAIGVSPGFTIIGSSLVITPGSNTTLTATGNINYGGSSQFDTVRGQNVTLNAGGNIGSGASPLMTSASNLKINGGGDAFIQANDDFPLLGTYQINVQKVTLPAGKTFNLQAFTLNDIPQNIKVTGPIAADNVILTTGANTNGNIWLAGNVGNAGGTLTMTADGTGSIYRTAGSILAHNITATTPQGDIGAFEQQTTTTTITKVNPLQITAPVGSPAQVALSAAQGPIYVNATGDVDLLASNNLSGKAFQVTDAGTLTINGAVTGGNINFKTTGNKDINVSSTINGSSITLNATGTGSITDTALLTSSATSLLSGSKNITASVAGGTVSAKTTGAGNITLDVQGPITLIGSNAGTLATGGVFNINDGTGSAITFNGDVKAVSLNINTNGALVEATGAKTGLAAKTINITQTGGANVGSSANPILLKGGTLVSSVSADAYFSNSVAPITLGSTTSAAGKFNLTSTTPITVTNDINSFDGITVTSTQLITFTNIVSTSLNANNSGTIAISGKSFTNAANVYLTANNGGTINLTSTGAGKTLTVGGTTGFVLNANGTASSPDGGVLNISSGGNLTVDTSDLSYSPFSPGPGTGGSVNLVAGSAGAGAVKVNGDLNVSPTGSASGGAISITTNSTTALQIGPTAGGANAVVGNLIADGSGSITVVNKGGGITTLTPILIGPAANSDGGQLTLSANLGVLNINGDLRADGAGTGNGGTIDLTASKGSIFIFGNLEATSLAQGGTINLTGNTASSLNVGHASVGLLNGIDGTIDVTGVAKGGTIHITNLGKGGVTVDPALLTFGPSAANGGSLRVVATTGGVLRVNGNLDLSGVNGNGGLIDLEAPKSTINVIGNLSADGNTTGAVTYAGGQIMLSSGSGLLMDIANAALSATANGTTGALSAIGSSGGAVTITNSGTGGIQTANNAVAVTPASGGTGGSLQIVATGGAARIKGTLDVDGAGGSGGLIGITTNSVTPFLIGTVGTGKNGVDGVSSLGNVGASLQITNNGAGGVTVNASPAVVSAGGTGGAITISAPKGVLTLNTDLSVDGGNGALTLTAASYKLGGPVLLSAEGISANAGQIKVVSTGSGKALTFDPSTITVDIMGASGKNNGSIDLESGGGLTVNPLALQLSQALSGDGANVKLVSGTAGNGTLWITSALSTPDGGSGNGGNVTITVKSTTPFIVGTPSLTAPNGINGGFDLTGSASSGSLTIKQVGTGGLTVKNPTANINVVGGTGSGGSIDLEALKQTMTLDAGTFSTNSSGGNAGDIKLLAGTFKYTGISEVALTANASGGGNGGNIIVSQTAAVPLTLGTGSSGMFSYDGNTGTGSGGTATFTNGAKIVVASNVGDLNTSVSLTVPGSSTIGTGNDPTATISAKAVTLTLGTGNVGVSDTNALVIDASSLTVTTKGKVFVSAGTTSTGALSVNAPSASYATFDLETLGNLNMVSGINSPIVSLTSNTQSVNLTGTIGTATGTTSIWAAGGQITQSGGVVRGAHVTLEGDVPNVVTGEVIGTLSSPIATATSNLTIQTTPNGGFAPQKAYIANTGTVNLNGFLTGLPSFSLFQMTNTNGNVTVSQTINADNIDIHTIGVAPGNILVTTGTTLGSGTPSSTITLNSNLTGSITTPGTALLQANSITLITGGGSIGSNLVPVNIQSSSATVTTASHGSAFILVGGNSPFTLNASSVGGTFSLTTPKDLTVAGVVTSPSLTLTSHGNITLNASVGSVNGITSILSTVIRDANGAVVGGGGNIVQTAGTVLGSVVTLEGDVATGGDVIGSSGTPISTATNNLTLLTLANPTFGTQQNAHVVNSGILFLNNFQSGNAFTTLNIQNDNSVTVTSSIASKDITITTTGAQPANIDILSGCVLGSTSPSTTVSLTAASTGTITTEGTGRIAGSNVSLTSSGGDIGSTSAPLNLSASIVTVNTGGNAVLANGGNNPFTINASTVGGALSVTDSSGSLTVGGTLTVGPAIITGVVGKDLNLIETGSGSGIAVNTGANLLVNGGSILIQNQNTASGNISIGDNVTIQTLADKNALATNGTISFQIGTGSMPQQNANSAVFINAANGIQRGTTNGNAWGGTNPGQIHGVQANATTLNNTGQDIFFNVPNGSAATITFGNSVTVTADPPGSASVAPSSQQLQSVSMPASVTVVTSGANTPSVGVVGNVSSTNIGSAITPVTHATMTPGMQTPAFTAGTATILPTSAVASVPSTIDASASQVSNANSSLATVQHGGISMNADLANLDPDHVRLFDSGDAKRDGTFVGTGSMLVVPETDLTISTPMGPVHVAQGAVALVVVQPGVGVSVYDMHDNHRGDVYIDLPNGKFVLNPGKHVSVAVPEIAEFESINPFDSVSHRAITTSKGKAFNIFASEFSIPSAMKGLAMLGALVDSNNPNDIRVREAMLKNAAIIMQTKSSDGAYHRVGSKRPHSKLASAE